MLLCQLMFANFQPAQFLTGQSWLMDHKPSLVHSVMQGNRRTSDSSNSALSANAATLERLFILSGIPQKPMRITLRPPCSLETYGSKDISALCGRNIASFLFWASEDSFIPLTQTEDWFVLAAPALRLLDSSHCGNNMATRFCAHLNTSWNVHFWFWQCRCSSQPVIVSADANIDSSLVPIVDPTSTFSPVPVAVISR